MRKLTNASSVGALAGQIHRRCHEIRWFDRLCGTDRRPGTQILETFVKNGMSPFPQRFLEKTTQSTPAKIEMCKNTKCAKHKEKKNENASCVFTLFSRRRFGPLFQGFVVATMNGEV